MKTHFLIVFTSVLLSSCSSDVGRYQMLYVDSKNERAFIILDTKDGILMKREKYEYRNDKGDLGSYSIIEYRNYLTNETTFSVSPFVEAVEYPEWKKLHNKAFGE